MSKRIGILAIIAITVFAALIGSLIMEKLDTRPFKFEDFKSAEALKTFLELKYPIGLDANIALKDLSAAGAPCHVVDDVSKVFNDLKEYKYIGWCDYSASWLSWPPKEQYNVIILGDEDNKIIRFSVSKSSGFDI